MNAHEQALANFDAWYQGLLKRSSAGGTPRGTIGAALVVLERLETEWDLSISYQLAPQKGQVRGVSGSALKRILAKFDEHRPFLSEGGRTNRGVPGDIEQMLEALKRARLDCVEVTERAGVLKALQSYLVEKVRLWHSRKRLEFDFDPSKTAWETVREILEKAKADGKEGPVAQYLVGAKLQLRYPDIKVPNFSYSTSDQQQGRPGDFHLGETAFHVTVAPMLGVYARCKENLRNGLGVYLIVPHRGLEGARQNAELEAPGRITVDSVEAFVGGNIDEMSTFSRKNVVRQFRLLLETYNYRVNEIENDKSTMVEIPTALLR
ncbi:MAG TPA: DUF4928 family protein [Bryobacteraceae bacterium]|nr:DUF4928 family protein [Bryobacteraceae bacterium]